MVELVIWGYASTSDSIIEYRVLDTRTFQLYFEHSNFRVIDSSSRVSFFKLIAIISKDLNKKILGRQTDRKIDK